MSDYIEINDYFIVDQPLSKFIVCSIKPEDLLLISEPNPRNYKEELDNYLGIQREIQTENLKDLQKYIKTSDACFPNSIICSLNPDALVGFDSKNGPLKIKIKLENRIKPVFIIDGQHRLEAFKSNEYSKPFNLVVTFFIGLDIPDQAYLFSTINTKQKNLNKSLVQDLNELFIIETPEKIVHVLTKLFNKESKSPWKNRIKTLGTNDLNISSGVISQYSFAKQIIDLIYDAKKNNHELREELKINKRKALKFKSDKIFWNYYVNGKENNIYKVLLNYFNSLKTVFVEEWGNKDYILTKTTGYIAMMNFLEFIYPLEKETFWFDFIQVEKLFHQIKKKNVLNELTSDNYESGAKGQNRLLSDFKKSYKN